MKHVSWGVAAVLLVVSLPASATAQGRVDPGPPFSSVRWTGKFMTGLGGNLTLENEAGEERVQGLQPTYGFALEGASPVHRYLTLGGHVAMHWFNGEDLDAEDFDRNRVLDFDVVLRGRYPLHAYVPLEVYVAVPVGMSLSFLDDDFEARWNTNWSDADISTNLGWNVSVLAGGIAWLAPDLGVTLEAGWTHHVLSNNVEGRLLGVRFEETLHTTLDQLAVNLGVTLAF